MYPLRRRPGSRKGDREEIMELDKNCATLAVTCHHFATACEARLASPSQRRTEAEHGRLHSISDNVAAIAVANDDLIESVLCYHCVIDCRHWGCKHVLLSFGRLAQRSSNNAPAETRRRKRAGKNARVCQQKPSSKYRTSNGVSKMQTK